MDYYERKQRAKKDITKLYYENTSTNAIINHVGLKYGFGKKVVLEQIELLDELQLESNLKKAKKE